MIITVASQKGGTCKTTTASAIWAGLPRSLVVDLDPQGNLTTAVRANENDANCYSVLKKTIGPHEAIQKLDAGDIIAYAPELATLDKLSPRALANVLLPLKEEYQYIVIDTPPTLGNLTINALCATDILIIPVHADIFSLKGLDQLIGIVTSIRERYNPTLKIGGLLLTQYNSRAILKRDMQEAIAQLATKIGTRLFKSSIRDGVAVLEAQASGQDLFSYAPKAKVTLDYRAFLNELEEVINHG